MTTVIIADNTEIFLRGVKPDHQINNNRLLREITLSLSQHLHVCNLSNLVYLVGILTLR